MNIIKLSAINSTNDYLKKRTSRQHVENFTIVIANHQTEGKGQIGAIWNSEPGKNLTFSVLIKDLLQDINSIFNLNAAVAVSIVQALKAFQADDLSIKWPNDILAGNKKLGGILIENSIKNNGEIFSIVGIGLNVNQTDFAALPRASSLAALTGKEYALDVLLDEIVQNIKRNVAALMNGDTAVWDRYHQLLYKKGMPMPFESRGKQFMGIIKGVTANGSLEVLLEDDTVATYGVRDIQMLY